MAPETTIKKVRDKNEHGWYNVEVNFLDHPDWEGEPVATKKRDIAAAARELQGEPVELDFTHRKNGEYNNYFLNGVLPLKKSEPQFEPAERSSSTREYGYKTQPGDAWRMCLNNGGELAVRVMPQADFKEQVRYAYDWAKFFFFLRVPDSMFTPFGDVMPQHPGQTPPPSQFQSPAMVGSQSGFGDPGPDMSGPQPWDDPNPPY